MLVEGRTECKPGREESLFFLGNVSNPYAVLKYGQIKDYLTPDFFEAYEVWRLSHYSGSLPLSPVWGENPRHLVEAIVAFEEAYDTIRS
jgi:hypothetical protein